MIKDGRSGKGGGWICLQTGHEQSTWLNWRWIVRLTVLSRDRQGQYGQVVRVPYGEVLYCPPGCQPETHTIERDDVNLLREILNGQSNRLAG